MTELRPSLQRLYDHTTLVGCEVGTEKGEHASAIVRELEIERLYLVESFGQQPGSGPGCYTPSEGEALQQEAEKRLEGQPVVWVVKPSEEVTYGDIPELLDFVYIDGGHSYTQVWKDLTTFYPLVKPGGLLAGHDYDVPGLDFPVPEENGVNEAVDEFVNTVGLSPVSTEIDAGGGRADWWTWKE